MFRKAVMLSALAAMALLMPDSVDACRWQGARCDCQQQCNYHCGCEYQGECGHQLNYCQPRFRGSNSGKQWWPFDGPDEPEPPANPVDPAPDPAPLPPEPPPAPAEPKIPADHAKLNEYIAQHLGGFNRANFERNGITVDIYQARGKQRVAWVVDQQENWMNAFVKAFMHKSILGSQKAGLALVCHCPDDPNPPPEPMPEPGVDPLPVPDVDTPAEKRLYKSGGMDLVTAEATCRAAGLWLVVVHDKTGDVNRVVYGNEVTPAVKEKWRAVKAAQRSK